MSSLVNRLLNRLRRRTAGEWAAHAVISFFTGAAFLIGVIDGSTAWWVAAVWFFSAAIATCAALTKAHNARRLRQRELPGSQPDHAGTTERY